MAANAREYIGTCLVCAERKSSHLSPEVLLCFLPVPGYLWYHMPLDRVTGHPPSQGNTTILSIVDCFSKAVHGVALPKLTSACATAEFLINQVVHLHGLDIL